MIKLTKCLIIFLAQVALLVTGLHAQPSLKPETIKVTTPEYHPSFTNFELTPGTYKYWIGWQGIPAAEASVEVVQEGLNIRTKIKAVTVGLAAVFYDLDFNSDTLISGIDLTPIKSVLDTKENSKRKIFDLNFLPSNEIETTYTKVGKEPPVTSKFNPENFTLDPISASFLARSLDWKIGDAKQFDIFNGQTRYLIGLTVVDFAEMKVDGVMRKVMVVDPKVTNLSNPTKAAKFRGGKLYVSADPARDIVRLESKVFVGSVSAKMESFTPAKNALGTQVAMQFPQQQSQIKKKN